MTMTEMMIIGQVNGQSDKTFLPKDNPKSNNPRRRRLFLFDVVDKDTDEIMVTIVFPKSWFRKITGTGGGGAILAFIYAMMRLGLI